MYIWNSRWIMPWYCIPRRCPSNSRQANINDWGVTRRWGVVRIHVAGILVLNWTAAISTVHQEDMGDAKDDNNTQQRKENRLASLRMLILFGKLGSTNDLFKTALGVLKSVNCEPRHALDVIILTIGNLCEICKEKRWLAFRIVGVAVCKSGKTWNFEFHRALFRRRNVSWS